VIALNRPLDDKAAEALTAPKQYLEVICAPEVHDDAKERITSRSSWGDRVRLFTNATAKPEAGQLLARTVPGGMLVMTDDAEAPEEWVVATKRQPTAEERRDLELAWTVAKHVTSNAIVLAKNNATVGIGAGQMSRVDATAIAIDKAGERVAGSVLASDAFFPFPDSIEKAVAAGVTAFVQPGGSKKDADVIAAADAAGVAMILTGCRHFRH
jgi:phosphoribosylaminoimidazolecarboxamide formyltransferase/IMP cyclohydrolase